MSDNVNHPKHYTSHPSGIECIEVTEHFNFCIGNAIKYLWRNGLKDGNSNIQDLKKAIWYITREIETLEKLNASKSYKTSEQDFDIFLSLPANTG